MSETEMNLQNEFADASEQAQDISDGIDLDDTQEVSEDIIDQAQQSGQISEKQAQSLKKTLKIKVDGQELEETLDFEDEEGLKKYIQKAKAFEKRNQEFINYKSQMEQVLNIFKQDPSRVMKEFGIDPEEFAENTLKRKVEELKKSPEQLEREKMQKELEDLRNEKKRIEEEKQLAEMERLRNEQSQLIETDIDSALSDAKSILPRKNPAVIQRIASTMLAAIDAGYVNVSAKDVIPLVEKQFRQELQDIFKVIPDDVFETLATKERLDTYRKNSIAKKGAVKKAVTSTPKQLVQDTASKKEVEDKPKEQSNAKFRKMFSYHD